MHLTWVLKRMAFFKFRVNHQDDLNASAHQGQSMEVLRQKVRHRLIGSAILVLIAVIGFPLIFDTQPRPVALDVAIDIPDKARVGVQTPPTPLKNSTQVKAPPLDESIPSESPIKEPSQAQSPVSQVETVSAKPQAAAPVTPPPPAPSAKVAPVVAASTQSDSVSAHPKESAPKTSKSSEKVESVNAKAGLDPKEVIVPSTSNAAVQNASPSDSKKEASNKESSVAKDNKDKKEADKPKSDSGRFVIQVGAFTDDQKVKEIREKLEKASLHTFTQVVTLKDAKKTRVRLGPFATKEEANHTMTKVHALGYNPTLITLP